MRSYRHDGAVICARTTPEGFSGVAVVRCSGPGAIELVRRMAPNLPETVESHRAYFSRIIQANSGLRIDDALLLCFLEGRGYTGEEAVELNLHGNPLIVRQTLKTLQELGARLAEPGEFTLRAFLNGKIDLPQAEAVLKLIESRNEDAKALSLRQLRGSFSKTVNDIKGEVLEVLAHLEANIDFAAEDIVVYPETVIEKKIVRALGVVEEMLEHHQTVMRSDEDLNAVILGPPNVGKSSLMNRLARETVAIVSDLPGTTRDVVRTEIMLGGRVVQLSDTAGFRATTDQIEKLGMDLASERANSADLVLVVEAPGSPVTDETLLDLLEGRPVLRVFNKTDLLSDEDPRSAELIYVSAQDGRGVNELLDVMTEMLKLGRKAEDDDVFLLTQRTQGELTSVAKFLRSALQVLQTGDGSELAISDIQVALEALMRVLGERFDDQVMDQVFRQFCLGK
jgi:tRNA modification GTPase